MQRENEVSAAVDAGRHAGIARVTLYPLATLKFKPIAETDGLEAEQDGSISVWWERPPVEEDPC
jgi:hypothetical protein